MKTKLINFVLWPLNTFMVVMAVLIAVLLLLPNCSGPSTDRAPSIADNEELHVRIQDNRITVQTPTGSTSAYVPDDGRATVTVDKEGIVDLRVKSAGIAFRPVAGVLFTRNVNAVIGAQVFYWNRAAMYVGGAYPWSAFVGVGYRLDQVKLPNTSVFIAYTTKKEIGGGLCLRF